MKVSLDNPYGNVTIPRAKLKSADDSTVIVNPMALESTYNAKASQNPYAADPAANGESAQGPPGYDGRKSYTVRDDEEEEVGRCPACCYRCRRKK